ncbi:MAG TPA: hypothetical protein VK563_05555 [Puia sp.]|nr:hypothetical protein [Puia sp.]
MSKIFPAFALLSVTLLCTGTAFAQRATISNDTAFYNGKRYAVGDSVNLAYGSDQGKKFAFVKMGGALIGMRHLESRFYKATVKIDKVFTQLGKCYLRGKMVDQSLPPGYKVFIELEGAIDNKEIKE